MNCVIFTLPLHAQKIENRCRKTGDRTAWNINLS